MMNKVYRIAIAVLALAVVICGNDVYARTTIDVTGSGGTTIPPGSEEEYENQVQDLSDLNGPIVANAFALANTMGYPIGKSSIGGFPHFEAGLAVGAGFTNTVYYSDDEDAPDGSFPGIMANPVIHAGVGLPGGFDVIGKLFYFRLNMYDPGLESSTASLEEINMVSIGGKVRYNYIEDKTVIPFLLSFGGLTFSLGLDVMMGNMGVTGNYETEFEDITIEDSFGTLHTVTTAFDGDYDATISWTIVSLTTQAVAYIDIMYLFSFYTGLGLTGNLGFFSTDFNGDGDLTTDDPAYFAATGTDVVGTLNFQSTNSYTPDYFIPTWIFGLELNLTVLKITGETMVNLRNGEDVTLQAGVRIQI
ncbi:MAG: hypothetical protein ACOCWZ_06245 [Spirochaetota bacterium]